MEYQEIIIEIDGVDYPVNEPSLRIWNILNAMRDFHDDYEFGIKIICLLTGLSEEQVLRAKYSEIIGLSNLLSDYLLNMDNSFRKEFEYGGKMYHFLNLQNLSFGEFVDIDNFFSKNETYRQANMNELMALLYREKDGKKNKPVPYNAADLPERIELFKDLPVKYVNGALVFFYTLNAILSNPTQKYFRKWTLRTIPTVLLAAGGGIIRSISYRVRTFLSSMKLRKNH